jgi:amino acid transporter
LSRLTQSSKPVFARESTGLVKKLSLLDTISFNLGDQAVATVFGLMVYTVAVLPNGDQGMNLVVASLIAAAIMIPNLVVYTLMQRRVLRTGGDYVWTSRAFGGLFGSSITFMGVTLEWMPYMALIVISTVVALGSAGLSLGYSGAGSLIVAVGVTTANVPLVFAISVVIFAILIAMNVFMPKAVFKILSFLIVVGVAIMIFAFAIIAYMGQTGAQNYMASLGLSYSSVAAGYTGSTAINWNTTLAIVPIFILLSYAWFSAAASAGSEFKGKSGVRYNSIGGYLVAVALGTLGYAVMYFAGGFKFVTAAMVNSTLVADGFNLWSWAISATSNSAVAWIVAIGWMMLQISILMAGIVLVSRYMFAQSFDRFLPERLSHVSRRYGSPTIALGVILVITLILTAVGLYTYNTFYDFYGAILASWIYFAFVGIAAVIYAIKHDKGGAKAGLVLAGILSCASFLYMAYEFVWYPTIWGMSNLAYEYIVATFIAGVVIYLISKSYYKSKGIDISLAFKEIPPE